MRRSRMPANLGLVFHWHAEQSTQATMHLDRPFDIEPEGGTTYDGARLASTVDAAAGWLYAAGLRHGDRVVIVKDNHFDTVLTAAAAARIGALPVMMAPVRYVEAIKVMVLRSAPKVLVIGASVLDRAAAAGVDVATPDARVVVVGEPAGGLPTGAIPLDQLRGSPPPPVRVRPDDEPMVVTHSSGTTGVPKLVVHSADTGMIAGGARLEHFLLPLVLRRSDVVASSISFAHMRVLSWVAAHLQLAPRTLLVIADHALDSVQRVLTEHQVTTLETCPNIFQRWEELADRSPELFAQVRMFVSTFDAIHPRTVRKFLTASRRTFPIWSHGWGQSETGPMCCSMFTRWSVRSRSKPGVVTNNVGWPILCRVRAVDPETGRPTRNGTPGILMASTKGRCVSYLGEEDRHENKVSGRWWNTGDLGQRISWRRFRLIDREVDMIPGTSGIELESTLLDRLPTASEVVVLGTPGELPVPVLAMRDNQLDPEQWRSAVADLPELAEPVVIPWEDMPRTATWKVRRMALREQVLGTSKAIGSGQWT